MDDIILTENLSGKILSCFERILTNSILDVRWNHIVGQKQLNIHNFNDWFEYKRTEKSVIIFLLKYNKSSAWIVHLKWVNLMAYKLHLNVVN